MARLILPYQSVYDLNGDPISGAKMYFYGSGTTTPKDTYADSTLVTPNTNPVIADSQGQFGPIFLSGNYSCKLTDSNDVTQPDYPAEIESSVDTSSTVLLTGNQTVAGVKTFTDKLAVKSDEATIELEENDASADNRITQLVVNGEKFTLRFSNDSRDTFRDIFTVSASGNTVEFEGTDVIINGGKLSYDNSLSSKFKAGDIGAEVELVNISTAQELTNKTLPSPVIDDAISGTAVQDDDSFTSPSATKIASSESIKNYVDTQTGGTSPSFSAHKNGSNQSVTAGSFQLVTFPTEEFDTTGDFASNTWTPSVAGRYILTATVQYTNLNVGNDRQLAIYKNGAEYKTDFQNQVNAGGDESNSFSIIANANGSTDNFKVYTRHNKGTDGIVDGNSKYTFFTGSKVS